MNRPSITHIIYDLDGILLDTELYYTEATQIIVQRYGKAFDWSLKSRMIGKKEHDSARILTETLQLPISPEEYLAQRKPILESMFRNALPMSGAVSFTSHMRRHRVPQAVASSSNRHTFAIKTSAHKSWFKDFELVVLGDDPMVKAGKPAPDIFLLAAARLAVSPIHCLVFEDSPAGVLAAKAAGMAAVAIPDANLERDGVRNADQIIPSFRHFVPSEWGLPGP